jgi:hypothetical protein
MLAGVPRDRFGEVASRRHLEPHRHSLGPFKSRMTIARVGRQHEGNAGRRPTAL